MAATIEITESAEKDIRYRVWLYKRGVKSNEGLWLDCCIGNVSRVHGFSDAVESVVRDAWKNHKD